MYAEPMLDTLNGLGPCAACGHDPACGYASIAQGDGPERWFCHTEDHSCYMQQSTPLQLAWHDLNQSWDYDKREPDCWVEGHTCVEIHELGVDGPVAVVCERCGGQWPVPDGIKPS